MSYMASDAKFFETHGWFEICYYCRAMTNALTNKQIVLFISEITRAGRNRKLN